MTTNEQSPQQKKPVNLRLSPQAYEAAQRLADAAGISMSEVMRRALGTELFLHEMKEKGEKFLVEDKNNKVREVEFR